jgi:hypothetical protein
MKNVEILLETFESEIRKNGHHEFYYISEEEVDTGVVLNIEGKRYVFDSDGNLIKGTFGK